MIPRIVLTLALTLSAAGLMPQRVSAAGDEAKTLAADVATLRHCLAGKRPLQQESCIFMIANPCVGDEASKPPSEVEACHDREQRAWDLILNDAYQLLHDKLDADQAVKLRDMQRAWVTSRDRSCNFLYDFFQGTMANPMISYCNNQETGRRAIYLDGFADEVKSWKK